MLDETEYLALAQPELSRLVDALDRLPGDSLECELSNDIISIEFSDDTSYVINSHRAARQIWMAAEHTAWHFDWNQDSKEWIAKKTGDELWSQLSSLIERRLGKDSDLSALTHRS